MSENRQTIAQNLAARKLKKPNPIIYNVLGGVWKLLYYKKLGVHVDYKINPRDYKGAYIVVSNHASRMDYIYMGLPFLPKTLNFVVGYNEFFRSHLHGVFGVLNVIPKRNFVPDFYAIREITRIISSGGRVAIMPEGMSSISGANQPCAVGSGKLLKHFGVPVLYTMIRGGYLTNTKYCLDERYGRVDVTVDCLFSPEQLETMSESEITDKLNSALYNDDYEYNKVKRYKYDGRGQMAKNFGDLLYYCPKCGAEFAMRGEGDIIKCDKCGNGATITAEYDLVPLDGDCVIPETPTKWFELQRDRAYAEVRNDDFLLEDKVTLGMLPDYEYLTDLKTSNPVGTGTIRLTKSGFSFDGTKNGEPFSFEIEPKNLPTYGMCTDVKSFYTFVNGTFYEFTPARPSTEKWFLLTEELHRLCGGKWKDFKWSKRYSE